MRSNIQQRSSLGENIFRFVLMHLPGKITYKEIDEMITTVDKNEDWKISYSEFRVSNPVNLHRINEISNCKISIFRMHFSQNLSKNILHLTSFLNYLLQPKLLRDKILFLKSANADYVTLLNSFGKI